MLEQAGQQKQYSSTLEFPLKFFSRMRVGVVPQMKKPRNCLLYCAIFTSLSLSLSSFAHHSFSQAVMKLHYLVVALLATRVSATCIFGHGCDSGSASVQNADITVTNSGYSATQTKGNSNNSSNNNNNNGYANKHGNNYILTAQNTGYTTVTVDGGTSGISAFPATTWNGPHLKTTTVSTAGPTNSNGTGINQDTTNSSAPANTAGSTNTGAIAGGVVGGFGKYIVQNLRKAKKKNPST